MFAALPICMTTAILGLATAFVMTDIARSKHSTNPNPHNWWRGFQDLSTPQSVKAVALTAKA
jgi:hypothetical protein